MVVIGSRKDKLCVYHHWMGISPTCLEGVEQPHGQVGDQEKSHSLLANI